MTRRFRLLNIVLRGQRSALADHRGVTNLTGADAAALVAIVVSPADRSRGHDGIDRAAVRSAFGRTTCTMSAM
jgi:hypothetical protein